MRRTTRVFLIVTAFIVLTFVSVAAQVRPDQLDRGGEWLSWTPGQRATFVDGFVAGYLQGTHSACEVAEQLFVKPGKKYRIGDEHHPSEIPTARCLARMEEYSKFKYDETSGPDMRAYTDVITEFYTNHPEYRAILFVDLLKALSDRTYKTADQLYQMAVNGDLRLVR
jgi:hypothetical protein